MGTLSCHDTGFNCTTVIQEKTEDKIMAKALEHTR